MIWHAVAVAALGEVQFERTEQARQTRLRRLFALVLDAILFAVLSFVINSVYGPNQVSSPEAVPSGPLATYTAITAVTWPWQVLLGLAYFTIPEALFGATPGKQLMGICVVSAGGAPLTIKAVLVRNVLRIIDWLPFLYVLGGALTLFSEKSQRLGDTVAGTTVVSRVDAMAPGATRNAGRRARRLAGIVLVGAILLTFAFEYFGRPVLIIEDLYNERQMPMRNGYTLGSPQWSLGHIKYPITGIQGGSTNECLGSITFDWTWFGWRESGAYYACGV
jgi:uncharacterized RDD family membrane protein YckC